MNTEVAVPDDQVTNGDAECKRADHAIRAARAELRLAAPWLLRLSADPTRRAAYAMAMTALNALADPESSTAAIDDVREWSALKHGAVDAQSQATAILDVAEVVEVTAAIWKGREDERFAADRDDPYFLASERDPIALLRARLVARLGEGVPNTKTLTELIERHAAKGARNDLTTAGIVARILQGGHLLGARGEGETAFRRTLDRVMKILARRTRQGQPSTAGTTPGASTASLPCASEPATATQGAETVASAARPTGGRETPANVGHAMSTD